MDDGVGPLRVTHQLQDASHPLQTRLYAKMHVAVEVVHRLLVVRGMLLSPAATAGFDGRAILPVTHPSSGTQLVERLAQALDEGSSPRLEAITRPIPARSSPAATKATIWPEPPPVNGRVTGVTSVVVVCWTGSTTTVVFGASAAEVVVTGSVVLVTSLVVVLSGSVVVVSRDGRRCLQFGGRRLGHRRGRLQGPWWWSRATSSRCGRSTSVIEGHVLEVCGMVVDGRCEVLDDRGNEVLLEP